MSEYIVKAMSDLYSNVSFGGGGGGGGGGNISVADSGITLAQARTGGGLPSVGANGWGQAMNQGLKGAASAVTKSAFSDPEGCVGRPDFSQGDAYSGNRDYGGCAGR